jgi:tetratricopeptide (TPR) repeat protein
VATVLMNIADLVYLQGGLAEANTGYRQALNKYREIDYKDGEARALGNLGLLLEDEGKLSGAKQMFDQALAVTRPTNNRSVSAYALTGLGDVLAKEADFVGARTAYSESLAMRNEIGEKATAAESRLALADLTIAEGRPRDAENSAREARDEFLHESQADDALIANSVLAKSLLEQGRVADAQQIIDSASALAAKSQNRGVSLRFAIAAARVSAATGKVDQAKSSLAGVLGDAVKYGYLGYELEARLAQGAIEAKSNNGNVGREHLRELARIAGSKDFGLIARDALAAAHEGPSN